MTRSVNTSNTGARFQRVAVPGGRGSASDTNEIAALIAANSVFTTDAPTGLKAKIHDRAAELLHPFIHTLL